MASAKLRTQRTLHSIHSFYPLAARGTGDFRKFFVRGAGKFLVFRGMALWEGLQYLGGLNILMNFVRMSQTDFQKLSKNSFKFVLFMYCSSFHDNIGCNQYVFIQNVGLQLICVKFALRFSKSLKIAVSRENSGRLAIFFLQEGWVLS